MRVFGGDRKTRKKVQYQNITPCDDVGNDTVESVYQVLTLTRVGDSADWVLMLLLATVSTSILWRLLGVFVTAAQLSVSSSTSSTSSALQMSSRLMALELLLSTAFDLFIDLQRFAAVDSWMRFVWLALCPTLFFVLLPKTVKGWWWYCCCCCWLCCFVVGPFLFKFSPNDGDNFLWLWLSYNFDFVDSLPLCFDIEWTFNFTGWLEIGSWTFCCCCRWCSFFSGSFCVDEVSFFRLPSDSSPPLGHMVESKTSIEFVIAWSHRQQSRNSSIVTTPSWFLSIFWNEKREQKSYKLHVMLHKILASRYPSRGDGNKVTYIFISALLRFLRVGWNMLHLITQKCSLQCNQNMVRDFFLCN